MKKYSTKATRIKALKARFKQLNPQADPQEVDFDAEVDSKLSIGENLRDLQGSYPWFKWTKKPREKTNDDAYLKQIKHDLQETGYVAVKKGDLRKLLKKYNEPSLPHVVARLTVKPRAPKTSQTGRLTNVMLDRARKALPVGKRTSSTGKTYYEKRRNRSDKNPEARI